MIDGYDDPMINQGMKVIWIIWGAILASLAIYLFVAHFAGDQIRTNPLPKETFDILYYALMVLGAVILFMTRPLRNLVLKAGQGSVPPSRAISESVPRVRAILQKYATAVIISLALSESIGIFGLVLYFLGGDLMTLYLFIACSAMSMVYHRPKDEEVKALLEAQYGI